MHARTKTFSTQMPAANAAVAVVRVQPLGIALDPRDAS
jgi:hypothetical protein